jgi:hypothetical protein
MAGVNEQAKSAKKESELKEQQSLQSGEFSGGQSGRDDIEQEDMQESYFK